MNEIPLPWLYTFLDDENPQLAHAARQARDACHQAWDGVDAGWFLSTGPVQADMAVALLSAWLQPLGMALRGTIPPVGVCVLVCACYARGQRLAAVLRANPGLPWTPERYAELQTRLNDEPAPALVEPAAGLDPVVSQAVALLCRDDDPVALQQQPGARLETEGGESLKPGLLLAMLQAVERLDLRAARSQVSDVTPLPAAERLLHVAAQCVQQVSLERMPDGKLRPLYDTQFSPTTTHADAIERWLEHRVAAGVQQVEPLLKTELPVECRLAARPLCRRLPDNETLPVWPADVVDDFHTAGARDNVATRPDVAEALQYFIRGRGGGLGLVQDQAVEHSDIAPLVAWAEELALQAGVTRLEHLDCAAHALPFSLLDLLQGLAQGLQLPQAETGLPAENPGAHDSQADPAGADARAVRNLTRTLAEAPAAEGLVVLLHITRLRREDIQWLAHQVIAPLLARPDNGLRFLVHGNARIPGHRLMDLFPGAFDMVCELGPFTSEPLQQYLTTEAGFAAEAALERASRILQLTGGRPRDARVLLETAKYGQAW